LQKNTLAPGDSTVVELIYDTHTYKGKVDKNARVMTNDTTLTVDLAADVYMSPDTLSLIRFSPDKLEFDKDANRNKQTVTIENHSNSKLEITQSTVPLDNMKLKIKDDNIKPGKTGRVEFEWKGDYPKADLAHSVTFQTGLDSMPRFTLGYVIKGTEPPPRPIPPKDITRAPNSDKPTMQMNTQQNPVTGNGAMTQPKPIQAPPTFVTPKVPSDTPDSTQPPKPTPKEEPKTTK
jgi:hypothetical protein